VTEGLVFNPSVTFLLLLATCQELIHAGSIFSIDSYTKYLKKNTR